jgi:cytochrome P450
VLGDHTIVLSGSKALGQVFYNSSLVQRREALPSHIAALLGRDILPALDDIRHAEVRAVIMQAINTRGVIQAHLSTLDRVMNKCVASPRSSHLVRVLTPCTLTTPTGTWRAGRRRAPRSIC